MADYRQTDTSATAVTGLAPLAKWVMSAGAVAGSISRSAAIATAGAAASVAFAEYHTALGDPGTASWVGAVTMRIDITTANANITWSELRWFKCQRQDSDIAWSSTALTSTSGLGISFGTTGVKTASVEATSVSTLTGSTASYVAAVTSLVSNGATMTATFNYRSDQLVTMPFTASAAPAPSAIFTLAQMNVGQ